MEGAKHSLRGGIFLEFENPKSGEEPEILEGTVQKYAKRIPSKEDFFTALSTKSEVEIDRIEDIFPFLVWIHERTHHSQLLSTVYGLLLWRLHHQIHTKMQFLIGKIRESDIQKECVFPLLDWYKSASFQKIKKMNPYPDRKFINNLERIYGVNESQYQANYANNVKQNFRELELLLYFSHLLHSKDMISMRDFVRLANKTFKILKEMDDLNVNIEWKSHNINAPSYLPPDPISSEEILEIDARCAQLIMLSMYKINKNEVGKCLSYLLNNALGEKTKSLLVSMAG